MSKHIWIKYKSDTKKVFKNVSVYGEKNPYKE